MDERVRSSTMASGAMVALVTGGTAVRAMTTSKRLPALTAVIALLTGSLIAGMAMPAAADEGANDGVTFNIDNFAGDRMGTRTLVPQAPMNCDVTGNTNLTDGAGTMKVDIVVPDTFGCNYGSAAIRWDAPTSVDIEQGGADRLQLKYRDVLPNQSGALTFGLRLVDVNGRVAQVGGISRNGGSAGDFLTIRYAPAYVGDVAVLDFDNGFDKSQVKSVTLLVAATKNNQNVSVTFEGLGANVGEPSYAAPVIGAEDQYAFLASQQSEYSFTVTGYPAPDLSFTSVPGWMTVSTTKGYSATEVTLSGNPGTNYTQTSILVRANVANSLSASRSVPIVVPSPVTLTYSTASATKGVAGPVALGTAVSTPGPSIIGEPTGLPAGTALAMNGNSVDLTGTPTESGEFTIEASVGNDWEDAAFSRALVVGESPTLVDTEQIDLQRDVEMTPIALASSGYPGPVFTSTALPEGLTLSPAGVITGTPTTNGTTTVTVTVTNDFGTSDTSLDVNVGQAPALTAIDDVALPLGAQIDAITVGASGSPAPTLTSSELPDGLSLTASGTVEGTPTAVGATTVTITATNDFGSADESFTINVGAAPSLTVAPSFDAIMGDPFSLAFDLTGTDAGVTASGLPDGIELVTDADGVSLAGTPTLAPGINLASGSVLLTATSDYGVAQATVSWTVERHEAPVIFVNDALLVDVGDEVDLPVIATGLPAASVTVEGLPAGLSWVPGVVGGRIQGTVTATGTSSVIIRATNGVGDGAEATLIITAELPVIDLTISASSVMPGQTIDLVASGFPANDPVEAVLHSEPTLVGSSVANAEGVLMLSVTIPADTPAGSHTLVVTGGSGASASASLQVLVPIATDDPIDPNSADGNGSDGSGEDDDSLAATGSNLSSGALAALLCVMAGALALGIRRRRM